MKEYIDKSALVAEIERLENDEFLCDSYDMATGFQSALRMVQEFIDTLEVKEAEEEPVSNDLEESSRHYLLNEHVSPLNDVFHQCDLKTEMLYHKDIENAFKAGAKWQKEQLMENVVEAVIHPYDGEIWVDKDLLSIYDDCQRVKLIIIKEK